MLRHAAGRTEDEPLEDTGDGWGVPGSHIMHGTSDGDGFLETASLNWEVRFEYEDAGIRP